MDIDSPDETLESEAELKKRIRRLAMDMLARREHSSHELFTKLTRRFSDIAEVEDVLYVLKEEKLQSDQRFAEAFVRYRSQKGQGPVRIRQELVQKAVSESIVTDVIESSDIDWRQIAQNTYEKKYANKAIQDNNERARRQRFMQYRGFSYEHYDL